MKGYLAQLLFLLSGIPVLFFSCRSIDEIAIDKISSMMASDSGTASFLQDDDPLLVADALPFILKMYEMLIAMNPEDADLRLAAGKGFVMYANAFIQTPAVMLSDDLWEQQEQMLQRARNMYLRGRDYILDGLVMKLDLQEDPLEMEPDIFLGEVEKEDASSLYWAAAGWLGAFSCNPLDMNLGSRIYLPVDYLYRALALDEAVENGGLHDLLITIWSSLPAGIIGKAFLAAPETGAFSAAYYEGNGISSGPEDRARFHLNEALVLSGGLNPSPYLSYATGFPVMQQDYETFESMLQKALAIDPDEDPDNRLTILVMQDKAAWYLEHREDFFLVDF